MNGLRLRRRLRAHVIELRRNALVSRLRYAWRYNCSNVLLGRRRGSQHTWHLQVGYRSDWRNVDQAACGT